MMTSDEEPAAPPLVPVPADEPENPVARISYHPSHEEAQGLLRAVLASGERGSRALTVTEGAIESNMADYTAWQVRWECLQAAGLGEPLLRREMGHLEEIGAANPKNYQIWNHRQVDLRDDRGNRRTTL